MLWNGPRNTRLPLELPLTKSTWGSSWQGTLKTYWPRKSNYNSIMQKLGACYKKYRLCFQLIPVFYLEQYQMRFEKPETMQRQWVFVMTSLSNKSMIFYLNCPLSPNTMHCRHNTQQGSRSHTRGPFWKSKKSLSLPPDQVSELASNLQVCFVWNRRYCKLFMHGNAAQARTSSNATLAASITCIIIIVDLPFKIYCHWQRNSE